MISADALDRFTKNPSSLQHEWNYTWQWTMGAGVFQVAWLVGGGAACSNPVEQMAGLEGPTMRTSVDRVSRRPVPVFLGIVLTLGVAAAIVACDPVPDPPNWSANISAQGVSLAFCEPLVADELGADIEQSSGSRWREVWRVDGTIRAETGDLLLMGDKKPGMTSDEYLRDVIGPRSIILVFAYRNGQQVERALFDFSQASDDRPWVHSQGESSQQPCG